MHDLGPKELELITALRASDNPEPGDQERIRRRVWLAIGLAAAGTSGVAVGTQTAVAATPKAGLLIAAAKLGVVAGLATGGAVYATQHFVSASDGAHEVMTGSASNEQPAPMVEVSGVADGDRASESTPPRAAPLRSESERSPYAIKKANAPAVTAQVTDLDGEVQLLQRARHALQASDYRTALDSLDEHARRFPKGVLASEREASRAIALCRNGQLDAGKARGARYLKRNPTSPLADRVRVSCKLD